MAETFLKLIRDAFFRRILDAGRTVDLVGTARLIRSKPPHLGGGEGATTPTGTKPVPPMDLEDES
jgi:hypothetical protein